MLLGWFSEKVPGFNSWLSSEVDRIGLPNLVLVAPFVVNEEMLLADGVHLIPAAGDQLLAQLCDSVTACLQSSDVTLIDVNAVDSSDAEVQPLPEADADKLGAILSIVQSNSRKLNSVTPMKNTLARLEASTIAFEVQVNYL